MYLKDLKEGQKRVDIRVLITKKFEPRTIKTRNGEEVKVVDCKVRDKEKTEGYLSLWREQGDQFNVGDIVQVKNGFCSMYKGNINLTSGLYGKLEKVKK